MIWKNARWIIILAITLIILYLLFNYIFKKKEGLDNDVESDIPKGITDLNGIIPDFPNIKKNAIIKLKSEGYDISGLDVQYQTIRDSINSSLSTYMSTFKQNQVNDQTDFVWTFATTFVKSKNDISLDATKTGVDAGTISMPASWKSVIQPDGIPLTGTNPFKDQFGGVDISSSQIIDKKSGTVDFVENSNDTMKLTEFSPFGLLNYYYLKLYVVTEWYMFYLNSPTINVTNIKGTDNPNQALLDKRQADIKNAQAEADAANANYQRVKPQKCGSRPDCPGRWDYVNGMSGVADAANVALSLLINGNAGSSDLNAQLSLAAIQAKIDSSASKIATDLKLAQDTAQNKYQIFRASSLTSLPGLLPGILSDISKNIIIIKNIDNALKKLTESYVASYAAKKTASDYLIAISNSNLSIPQMIKTAVPRFFDNANSFDINQIEDYSGDITDNIKKLHLLNAFNSAYNSTANATSKNTSNALIQMILKNVTTNIAYFEDSYVKSDSKFRKMDKYTYTFDRCNAVNFITDVYYRDITYISDTVYGYIIDKVYQKSSTDPEDVPICDLTSSNSSSNSPSDSNSPSESTNQCAISPDNIYASMRNIERNLYDSNPGIMKDIGTIDDETKKRILAYGRIYIDKLLNIRNFIFMLFIRCGMMIKYVIDNSIYTILNTEETPINGSLYTIGEFIMKCASTRLYTESSTQYEIERFIYYLSEFGLDKIYDSLYYQYTAQYTHRPDKKIINLSQGQNIRDAAIQFLSYVESSNKFTDNIALLYSKIYASLTDSTVYSYQNKTKQDFIKADIDFCNSNYNTNLSFDLKKYDPSTYNLDSINIAGGTTIPASTNDTLLQNCRNIKSRLQNYLYLPTYFSNGSLNGCFQDPTRTGMFTDTNSFQISVVTKTTGSDKLDKYGAVINCINDTVAYNNVNSTKYDTVTLKAYSPEAYSCSAAKSSDVFNSGLKSETDVSKCYIDKDANIADTTITYNVNPMKFDPKKDTLIFRGCYATNDISNGIYNTLPHRIGGDLSQIALYNSADPNAAIKECQRLVLEKNKKERTNYDIFGITSDPIDTQKLLCFAGNSKFDAAHALDSNLSRSDYTQGCNVQYPGPGNYMVFQDSSAALNSCKTPSQIALDKYNDLKTNWMNKNVKNQSDSLKLVSGMIDDIDKRFPIKFEIATTYLVKQGSSQPPNIEILAPTSSTPGLSPGASSVTSLNNIKLNMYIAQGPKGNKGRKGDQGKMGSNAVGDPGLPGYQGYYG